MDEIALPVIILGSLCALPAMVMGMGVFRCFFGGLLFPWGMGMAAVAVGAGFLKEGQPGFCLVIPSLVVSFLAMAAGVAVEKRLKAKLKRRRDGAADIEEAPPPAPEQVKPPTRFAIRLVIALLVGASVAGISLVAAYQQCRRLDVMCFEQMSTRMTLRNVARAIESFVTERGRLPVSLDDLRTLEDDRFSCVLEDGLEDGWGRPMAWEATETSFLLKSYGKDGLPGGTGLDCDLSTADLSTPESVMTFRQFLSNRASQPMILGCAYCGLLAFVTAFAFARPTCFSGARIVLLLFGLAATLFGSTVIAVFMAALEVPSGH